jgi:FkbM family methyltransferase
MTAAPAADMRSHFEALLGRNRDYRQEVRDLAARYPKVVFYGCGAILHSIVDSWNEQVGRRIDFVADSDPAKWGRTYCGATCLSPDELAGMKDECAVFVTIGDFKPVYDTLVARGFPCVNQLFKYDLLASEFLPRHDKGEVASSLARTWEALGDDASRRVFSAIVGRVLGRGDDIDVMVNVAEGDQYFPPGLVRITPEEHLVDVGAYNGDTVRDFVRRSRGAFRRISAFELDAENFRQLEANVATMPERDRIDIHNLGAWDAEMEVTYSVGKSQSTVGAGEGRGRVARLDDVLRGAPVTMIKMDIEGAEPHGLRGARELIQTRRPKLAICIYHDFRHLWEIPLYILSLRPDYTIHLRHHTNLEYETVCYALPKDRP